MKIIAALIPRQIYAFTKTNLQLITKTNMHLYQDEKTPSLRQRTAKDAHFRKTAISLHPEVPFALFDGRY